ncbi:hypothetical protein N474_01300 [Pseudoalteromonas luteoviolacea CPMOR-2]|uniref:M1 family aminopeptidase n=1 Tax=Pseudoalteromonas luteoviolacea TaxID=43657 RepID=UPI0007B0C0C7|nr:M1 family aminopeptidase [Pseudoalteromonas luteoviolacea]KZN54377.1 hypothetical protein N474_01300 [Pseudoalteromonas luteoviolacea CPMOR-2]
MLVRRIAQCILSVLLLFSISSPANDAFRLPEHTQLVEQIIHLNIDPQSNSFTGHATLKLNVQSPTRYISYHSKNLEISEVSLQYQDKRHQLSIEQANQYEIVSHTVPFELSGDASLSIHFNGYLSKHMEGLYQANHEGEPTYLLTQFQSMEARSVFPTFDEPNKKSIYKFSVSTPIGYDVLHNTPVKTITKQKSVTLTQFRATPMTNTDILSFAIGKFETRHLYPSRYQSKVYSPQGLDVVLPEYFDRLVDASILSIEQYLDTPFPFNKLDFVIGNYGSVAAMENLGLVSLNVNQVPSKDATDMAHCQFKKLIAHEVAHSWFGNDITMAWYDDYWLNESFTEFMAAKVVQSLYPNQDMCIYTPQSSAFKDDTSNAMPLIFDVKSRKDTLAYGQLHYTKGRAVLEMLEQAMGDHKFQALMRRYVSLFSGKNVSTQQFVDLLKDPKLQNVVTDFTQTAGYPLLTLKQNKDQLVISQRDMSNRANQLWSIPVSLKLWDGKRTSVHKMVLSQQSQTIALAGQVKAIFMDAGGAGYFRYINQSKYNDIDFKHLSQEEQASFRDNEQALAIAGYINYMQYIQNMVTELNQLPLSATRSNHIVSALNDAYLEHIQHNDVYAFNAYLKQSIHLQLDWKSLLNKPYAGELLKLFGVYLGDSKAINAAQIAYQSKSHHAHLESIVMTLARHTDIEHYKVLVNDFKKTPKPQRETVLSALGYVDSASKADLYYDLLLSDDTQGMVIDYRFQFPIFNPVLREAAAQLISDKKGAIFKRVSQESLQWFPYNFLLACSTKQKQAMHQLFKGWQDIPGLSKKLTVVSDGIDQCILDSKHIGNSLQTLSEAI